MNRSLQGVAKLTRDIAKRIRCLQNCRVTLQNVFVRLPVPTSLAVLCLFSLTMVYKTRVFLTQEKKEIASNTLKQGNRHSEIAHRKRIRAGAGAPGAVCGSTLLDPAHRISSFWMKRAFIRATHYRVGLMQQSATRSVSCLAAIGVHGVVVETEIETDRETQ